MTYAGALGTGVSNAEREAYKASAEEAKAKRNILVLRSTKTTSGQDKTSNKMGQNEWAELIFDKCKIKVEDVTGIDFNSAGINTVEIELKEGSPSDRYEGNYNFKDQDFSLVRANTTSKKITFKNVPLQIPDSELIHLVKAYGGKMEKEEGICEKNTISTPGGVKTETKSSTRYIQATFPPNKRLKTFYWVAGQLSNDPMRRIIAEHDGQIGRQCGSCLKNSADPINPCKFNGKTSACRKNDPAGRSSLSKYFERLRTEDNYVSLKNQYMWSEDDEETNRQKYTDEFVELNEGEGEKENYNSNSDQNSWAEEMAKEEETKQRLINNLKKEKQKARRQVQLGRDATIKMIADMIRNPEDVERNKDAVVTLMSISSNVDDFEIKGRGFDEKVRKKQGKDPWKDLYKRLDSLVAPLTEVEKERVEELIAKAEQGLGNRIRGWDKDPNYSRTRSPSVTRRRSEEANDDERDLLTTKSAKLETSNNVEEEEKKKEEKGEKPTKAQ